MEDKLSLEIVTPERQVVKEMVDEVAAPGTLGYFGILPGHIPFLTTLKIGEISYRSERETHHLAISWGYAEVGPEKVVILAETVEMAEEIDVARAQQAQARAEQRLKERDSDVEFARAQVALEKALIRVQVAGRKLSQG